MSVLDLAASRPPTLGSGRLICIDGPAGSGKTSLAATLDGEARVLHMDDLYPGWSGLLRTEPHVLGILEPLSRDQPGRYRRFDWTAGEYAEEHVVEPTPLLVLEGVGAGSVAWSSWTTVLVWVEAPPALRLQRGLDRDGREIRDAWLAWAEDEQVLFARERTRARADLVIETGPARGSTAPGSPAGTRTGPGATPHD